MQVFDGHKLAALRKAAGYTQKSFGESIGALERMVQFWEADSRHPNATYLLRAMSLLNCTPADLLTDEPES